MGSFDLGDSLNYTLLLSNIYIRSFRSSSLSKYYSSIQYWMDVLVKEKAIERKYKAHKIKIPIKLKKENGLKTGKCQMNAEKK